jgi:hypothetical protein
MANVPVTLVFVLLLASFAVEHAASAVDNALMVAQDDTPKESEHEDKAASARARSDSVELYHKQYAQAEQDFEALHAKYTENNAVFSKLKKQARLLAHELDNMRHGARYKATKLKLRQVERQARSSRNGLLKLGKEIKDSKHDLLAKYAFNHQVAVSTATSFAQRNNQITRKLDYARSQVGQQRTKLAAELHRFTTLAKPRPEFVPLTKRATARAKVVVEDRRAQVIHDKQALKDMKAAVLKAAKGSKMQKKRAAEAYKLAENSVEIANQNLEKAVKVVRTRETELETVKKQITKAPPSVCDSGFGSAKADCGSILGFMREDLDALKMKSKKLTLQGADKGTIGEVVAEVSDLTNKMVTAKDDKSKCLAAADDTFRQCKLALFNKKETSTDIVNLEKEQKELAKTKRYADEDAITNKNMLASMTNHVNKDRRPVMPQGVFQYDNTVWYVNSDGQKQLVQYPTPPCHRASRGITPANFEDAPGMSLYLGKEESTKACEGPAYDSLGDTTIYAHCKCNGVTDPHSNSGGKCARWGPAKKAWCFVSHRCQYPGASPLRKDGGTVPSYNKVLEDCPQEDQDLVKSF